MPKELLNKNIFAEVSLPHNVKLTKISAMSFVPR